MPASPFPDERRRRRLRGGSGSPLLLIVGVVVVVLVVVGIMAVAGIGPIGGDDDSTSGDQTTNPTAPAETGEALPLGQFSEASLSANGAGGAGSQCPTGAECREFQVSCPDVPDAEAGAMAVSPAQGDPRGLVVFFSGGKGSNWWEDGVRRGTGEAHGFVTQLQSAGYEVVQVRWVDGFSANPTRADVGFSRIACRGATAVDWVYHNEYEPLGLDPASGDCGFCISGNSGGSSQAAWSLTHYGLADEVDAALLTSGPPHAALAAGCLQEGDQSEWYDRGSAQGFDEVYGAAGRGSEGPCSAHDSSFEDQFLADGVDTGGAFYDYADTRVVFILGDRDQTVAPEHAQAYIDRLQEDGSPMVDVQHIGAMGHEITQSQAGLSALFVAIPGQT